MNVGMDEEQDHHEGMDEVFWDQKLIPQDIRVTNRNPEHDCERHSCIVSVPNR